MQEVLIIILFLAALAYLGWQFIKSSKGEANCSSNCGCDSSIRKAPVTSDRKH